MTERRRRNEARCERILDSAAPLVLDDLAWDDVGAVELDPATIATLVYMRDVEGFTDRDPVGLTAHPTTMSDPLIARFIGVWRSEEAGHAEALDTFLHRYAAARGIDVPPRQSPPPSVAPWQERVITKVRGTVGAVVAAAHMTWGAANELLTLNGYRMLGRRNEEHPVLGELLHRIADQEAKHYSFYLLQAEWRLGESRAARFVLPRLLGKAWTPVGVGDGYKTHEEFGDVLRHLVAGDEGERAIDRMDKRFASLPGLHDLRIYRRAAAGVA